MNPTHPFFSIIVASYNRGPLLIETVNSILSQTDVTLEIIVVDDGSTDQTEQLVSQIKDERIRYFKTKNLERGAARNMGLRKANGSFVNYFDSDDLYYPCLSIIREFIVKNNFPPVVYGGIHDLEPDGTVVQQPRLPYATFKENIRYNNFLACGSVFVKTEIANACFFSDDRRLSGSEDWELWLRLYSQYDFKEVPIIVFKQRKHPSRSLFNTDAGQVTIRENLFSQLINANRSVLAKRFSDSEINLLMADRMTLIALTQFVAGNRGLAFHYWGRALKLSIQVVKRRRFLAMAKKLMFS
jgi:glycosyltransferase involved in cell wall biosynthesis